MVPAFVALLVWVRDGLHGRGTYGPSLPARGFQVPTRNELAHGHALAALDVGHGVQRPSLTLGCRRLLGSGCRRVDGRARPGVGPVPRRSAPWRPDHWRRQPEPILCAARICNPRPAVDLPCAASLAGAEARD